LKQSSEEETHYKKTLWSRFRDQRRKQGNSLLALFGSHTDPLGGIEGNRQSTLWTPLPQEEQVKEGMPSRSFQGLLKLLSGPPEIFPVKVDFREKPMERGEVFPP